MKKLLVVASLLLGLGLVVSCAPAGPGAPAEQKRLLLGATSATSGYYLYEVGAAKAINKAVPEVNITVVETGAAIDNLLRLRKGELDFVLGFHYIHYEALKGLGARWEKEPMTDLRLLWVFSKDVFPFVVREDSGIKTLKDLDGKDWSPGGVGFASAEVARRVLEANGIKPKYHVGGFDDALAATKDRRIAGFAKLSGLKSPDASIVDLMTATPIRVLEWPQEMIDKAQKEYPHYRLAEVPVGLFKNDKPILTWGGFVAQVALSKFPEDIAYKITKAVNEDKVEQAAAYPANVGFEYAKATMEAGSIPLHAGAQRYFKELGLSIPQALLSPEAK